jgi:hypothetical protein
MIERAGESTVVTTGAGDGTLGGPASAGAAKASTISANPLNNAGKSREAGTLREGSSFREGSSRRPSH